MIPVKMLEAICEEIRKAVKDYRLETEFDGLKPVSVYLQHIPDEEFEDNSYYPLIIVNVANVTDNQDGKSVVEVALAIGVYGENMDAWRDLLSIMERIRQHFCINHIIASKYHVQLPNTWETAEHQPYPYWYGYGSLKFVVAQPRRSLPEFENTNE